MGRVRGRHLLRWSKGGGESVANFSMVYARSALCDARFGQKAYGLRGFGRIGCVNQGVFGQKIGIGAKAAKRRGGCRERAGDGVAGAMTAGEGHEGDAAAGRGVSLRVSGRGGRTRGSLVGGANARGATVTAACVMRPSCGNGERERLRTCGGGECGQRSRGGAKRVGATNSAACCAGPMPPELAAPRVRLSTLQRPAPSAPAAFAPPLACRNLARSALLRLRSRALWPQHDPQPPFASYGRAPLHVPPKLLGLVLPGLAYPAASASVPARAPHHARVRPTAPALSAPPGRSAPDGSGSPAWRRCA